MSTYRKGGGEGRDRGGSGRKEGEEQGPLQGTLMASVLSFGLVHISTSYLNEDVRACLAYQI